MELKPDDIELLDRYFRGELNDGELTNLQIRLNDPEFAEEVQAYTVVFQAIQAAGQTELKESLSVIRKEIESKKEFEKYRPTHKGGSGIGSYLIAGMLIGSIALVYFLLSNDKTFENFKNTFQDEIPLDTVYHYRINRDTVFVKSKDSVQGKPVKRIKSDTVYIRVKKSSVLLSDSITKEMEGTRKTNQLPH